MKPCPDTFPFPLVALDETASTNQYPVSYTHLHSAKNRLPFPYLLLLKGLMLLTI